AFARDLHTQQIAIKAQTGFGISDDNRGVVDSEKKPARGSAPFFRALILRELQNLEWMPVRIFEIERLDSRSVLVPIGKALLPGRCMLDLVLAQPGIGFIHVADDDRNVLE